MPRAVSRLIKDPRFQGATLDEQGQILGGFYDREIKENPHLSEELETEKILTQRIHTERANALDENPITRAASKEKVRLLKGFAGTLNNGIPDPEMSRILTVNLDEIDKRRDSYQKDYEKKVNDEFNRVNKGETLIELAQMVNDDGIRSFLGPTDGTIKGAVTGAIKGSWDTITGGVAGDRYKKSKALLDEQTSGASDTFLKLEKEQNRLGFEGPVYSTFYTKDPRIKPIAAVMMDDDEISSLLRDAGAAEGNIKLFVEERLPVIREETVTLISSLRTNLKGTSWLGGDVDNMNDVELSRFLITKMGEAGSIRAFEQGAGAWAAETTGSIQSLAGIAADKIGFGIKGGGVGGRIGAGSVGDTAGGESLIGEFLRGAGKNSRKRAAALRLLTAQIPGDWAQLIGELGEVAPDLVASLVPGYRAGKAASKAAIPAAERVAAAAKGVGLTEAAAKEAGAKVIQSARQRAALNASAVVSGATGGMRTTGSALDRGVGDDRAIIAGLKSGLITAGAVKGMGLSGIQAIFAKGGVKREGFTRTLGNVFFKESPKEALEEIVDQAGQHLGVELDINPDATIDELAEGLYQSAKLGYLGAGVAGAGSGLVGWGAFVAAERAEKAGLQELADAVRESEANTAMMEEDIKAATSPMGDLLTPEVIESAKRHIHEGAERENRELTPEEVDDLAVLETGDMQKITERYDSAPEPTPAAEPATTARPPSPLTREQVVESVLSQQTEDINALGRDDIDEIIDGTTDEDGVVIKGLKGADSWVEVEVPVADIEGAPAVLGEDTYAGMDTEAPPVLTTYKEGRGLLLLDGRNRVAAARKDGKTTVTTFMTAEEYAAYQASAKKAPATPAAEPATTAPTPAPKIYHGTGSDFNDFDDGVVWFTPDKEVADSYRKRSTVRNQADEAGTDIEDEFLFESDGSIDQLAKDEGFNLEGGKIIEKDLPEGKQLDLTDQPNTINNVEDLEDTWKFLHEKGLVEDSWDDFDDDAINELRMQYFTNEDGSTGVALWKILEEEGVYDVARSSGYDTVRIRDVSTSGKEHDAIGVLNPKKLNNTPEATPVPKTPEAAPEEATPAAEPATTAPTPAPKTPEAAPEETTAAKPTEPVESPYSVDGLMKTYDLTRFQAVVAKAVGDALGAKPDVLIRGGTPGEGALDQFAGEKANVPQFMRNSLEAARAMAAAGKSSAEIRAVTGWFPGKHDGKMRWEIPDGEASFEAQALLKLDDQKPTRLGDLLNHNALFEFYPELADVKVVAHPDFRHSGGSITPTAGNPTITVGRAGGTEAISLSTLLHEIQHAIQMREGWSHGTSPESAVWEATESQIEGLRGEAKKAFEEDAVEADSIAQYQDFISKIKATDARKLDEALSLKNTEAARDLLGVPDGAFDLVLGVATSSKHLLSAASSMEASMKENLDSRKEGNRVADNGTTEELRMLFLKYPYFSQQLYRSNPGEIEAWDVAARSRMTPEQLKATEPYSSENISKEDSSVLFQESEMRQPPVSPEQDAEYLAAIESGDMETAQRMVDEAAKATGYDSPRVFHGSIEPNIKSFDLKSAVEVEGGIFFSDDISVADEYTYERAYGDIISEEPLGDITEAYLSLRNPLEYQTKPNQTIVDAVEMTRAIQSAKAEGHDGLIIRGIDDTVGATGDISDIFVAFKPNQIKSADPVTRDDDGNVIPLSQRFNPELTNILFQESEMRQSITPADIPKNEGGGMPLSDWDSLGENGYEPEASEGTQIATTGPTYQKILEKHATKDMVIVDFGAGRGIGTKAAKKAGYKIAGFEPFSNPEKRAVKPEYTEEGQIPDGSVDLIINNAVINVVPESSGREIVKSIYSKLAPGGSAFINVMGWGNIKGRLKNPKTKLVGPREVITQKGTFQKGYTPDHLLELIKAEAPRAIISRTRFGDIGYKVTKPEDYGVLYQDAYQQPPVSPEQAAEYMELAKNPKKNRSALQEMVDAAIQKSNHKAKGVRAGVYRDGIPLLPSERGLLGSGYYAILDGRREDVEEFAGPIVGPEASDKSLESRVDDLAIDLGDNPIFLDGTDGIGKYIRENGLVDQFEKWLAYQDAVNTAYKSIPADRPQSLEEIRGGTIQRDLENVGTYAGAGFKSQNTRNDANFLLDQVVSAIVVDHSKSHGERDFKEVVVANPNQIKSADPVTRDANGNVIPLDQRFNPESPSILYQDAPEFYSTLARALEGLSDIDTIREPAVKGRSFPAKTIKGKDGKVIKEIPARSEADKPARTITPRQTIERIFNESGVKPEEIKWTGIMTKVDELAAKNDGKVPIEELQKWLEAEGQVSFEEVSLGGEGAVSLEERRERIERAGYIVADDGFGDIESVETYGNVQFNDLPRQVQEDIQGLRDRTDREEPAAGETKYSDQTLPGGKNYRETVLTMPEVSDQFYSSFEEYWKAEFGYKPDEVFYEPAQKRAREKWEKAKGKIPVTDFGGGKVGRQTGNYTSSHFSDVLNYVAHMRRADFDEGTLLEEIQSDRHQEGRKKGYTGDTADDSEAIPDAPYRQSRDWGMAMFKRALRDAVLEGKTWIGWTDGETQNDRYDLSKQVGEIRHWKADEDGYYGIQVFETNGQTIIHENEMINPSELESLVGKDVAQRIIDNEGDAIENESKSLSGDGLRVGGEGMKGFYDKIMPTAIGKYVKQWGAKVEKSELEIMGTNGETGEKSPIPITEIWKVQITPEMAAEIKAEGQPLFQDTKGPKAKGAMEITETGKIILRGLQSPDFTTAVHELAHAARRHLAENLTPEEIKEVEAWAGAEGGKWNRNAEERWARGWEKYFREGKAPTSVLQPIFDQIAGWMKAVYANIKGSAIDVDISPEVLKIFDKLASKIEVESPAAKLPPKEPKAAEPKAAEPKAAEPKAAEPRAAEPRAAEPRAAEPRAAEPRAAEPEEGDAYERVLNSLPEQEREIFEAKIGGKSISEIAHNTGLTEQEVQESYDSTVKVVWSTITASNRDKTPISLTKLNIEERREKGKRAKILKQFTSRDGHEQAIEDARKMIEADPRAATNLVDSIIRRDTKTLSVLEMALLLVETNRLEEAKVVASEKVATAEARDPSETKEIANEKEKLKKQLDVLEGRVREGTVTDKIAKSTRKRISKKLDKLGSSRDVRPERLEDALNEWNEIEEKINRIEKASRLIGSEAGAALNFLKQMLNSDYSLAGMLQRARVAKQGGLTLTEQREIEEDHKELEPIIKDIAEGIEDQPREAIRKAYTKVLNDIRRGPVGDSPYFAWLKAQKEASSKRSESAKKRIRERMKRVSANPMGDVTLIGDLAIVAYDLILGGVTKSSEITANLVREFGDKVKPYTDEAIKKGREILKKKAEPESAPKKTKKDEEKEKSAEQKLLDFEKLITDSALNDDPLKKQRPIVLKYVRTLMESGVTEESDITAKVLSMLQGSYPSADLASVEDLISNYGEYSEPTKNATSKMLAQLKQQLLPQGKIRDILAGQPPKRTGRGVTETNSIARIRNKRVRELMRKHNIELTDPAKQLAASRAATMTRLQHEIDDMDLAIANNVEIRTPENATQVDQVVEWKKAERDAKREEYNAIFGPEAERRRAEKAILRSLDVQIQNIDNDLENNKLYPDPKSPPYTNAQIEAKRKRRDELLEERRKARKAEEGSSESVERREQLEEQALDRAISRAEHDLKMGNIHPKSKPLKSTSAVLMAKRAHLNHLKAEKENLKALNSLDEESKRTDAIMRSIIRALNPAVEKKQGKVYVESAEMQRLRDILEDIMEARKKDPDAVNKKMKRLEETALKKLNKLKAMIAKGDFEVKKKPSVEASERLADLREQIATLNEVVQGARKAKGSGKLSMEARNKLFEARTLASIADMENRMASGNLVKGKAPDIKLTKKNRILLGKREDIKERFQRRLLKLRLSQMNKIDRVINGFSFMASGTRTILTSGDVSASLRQGGWLASSHPLLALKAQLESLSALEGEIGKLSFNKGGYSAIKTKITESEEFAFMEDAGLEFTWMDVDSTHHEELFGNVLVNNLPIVKQSGQHFTAYLNILRANVFTSIKNNMELGGDYKMGVDDAKALAHIINLSTGRVGKGKIVTKIVNHLGFLFSPQLTLSRFMMLGFEPLWLTHKASPKMKRKILAEYGRSMGSVMTLLALASLAGAAWPEEEISVSYDISSPDFLKIRHGNARHDVLFGLQQAARFMAATTASAVISRTDKEELWGFENGRAFDMKLMKFGRSKLNPLLGAGWTAYSGTDFKGDEVPLFPKLDFSEGFSQALWDSWLDDDVISGLLCPMILSDTLDSWNDEGAMAGIETFLTNFIGIGSQRYEDREPRRSKKGYGSL